MWGDMLGNGLSLNSAPSAFGQSGLGSGIQAPMAGQSSPFGGLGSGITAPMGGISMAGGSSMDPQKLAMALMSMKPPAHQSPASALAPIANKQSDYENYLHAWNQKNGVV